MYVCIYKISSLIEVFFVIFTYIHIYIVIYIYIYHIYSYIYIHIVYIHTYIHALGKMRVYVHMYVECMHIRTIHIHRTLRWQYIYIHIYMPSEKCEALCGPYNICMLSLLHTYVCMYHTYTYI